MKTLHRAARQSQKSKGKSQKAKVKRLMPQNIPSLLQPAKGSGGVAENHHSSRKPPPHGRGANPVFASHIPNRMKSQYFQPSSLARHLPLSRLQFGKKH
jgi:hypothetical protein